MRVLSERHRVPMYRFPPRLLRRPSLIQSGFHFPQEYRDIELSGAVDARTSHGLQGCVVERGEAGCEGVGCRRKDETGLAIDDRLAVTALIGREDTLSRSHPLKGRHSEVLVRAGRYQAAAAGVQLPQGRVRHLA